MNFRTVLFWIHLVAGLISGLSIGIMCFTGTVLAFEKELVAWSERDARLVAAPAPGTPRLSFEAMQAKLREAQPDLRPGSIVVQNDPRAAVSFSAGRGGGFYVNPYTGEVRAPRSKAMADFMHTMVDWHRFLGFHGEVSRPRGKLVNGICNLAFFVLAVTGLWLWMPRSWSWRALRPVIWFRQNSSGKARDFNWHNAIGFWSAPILIVLTLTAVPISFRWGGTLIYTLTGTEAPAGGSAGPSAFGGPPVDVPPPPPGAKPLGRDALFAAVQAAVPEWRTITLRTGGPSGGRGPRQPQPAATAESAERRTPEGSSRAGSTAAAAPSFTVREKASWPRTASTTVVLDPYTGAVLRRTGYADLNAAQQVRSWTRFLHTGEAVGPLGQFFAGLASLGGVFLVYTGFALSWRRFSGKKPNVSQGSRNFPRDNAAVGA
jgi:uncharacterized iron-regulated membrane protein